MNEITSYTQLEQSNRNKILRLIKVASAMINVIPQIKQVVQRLEELMIIIKNDPNDKSDLAIKIEELQQNVLVINDILIGNGGITNNV
jgi:hypothetical protein